MAREKLTRVNCDRCGKVVVETELNVETGPQLVGSAPETLLVLEARGPGLDSRVCFDDLCEKCKGRVVDLVNQIRLAKPEEEAKPESAPGTTLETSSSFKEPEAERDTAPETPHSRGRGRRGPREEVGGQG